MKKFIFLLSIWAICSLTIPQIIIGRNNYLEKNILKNDIQEMSSDLNNNIYNLMNISDKNIIYSKEKYLEYFKSVEKEDYEYFSQRIPEEYLFSFLYFTRNNSNLRNLVYAIMRHESINFTEYTNHNIDGSIDHGPMMLNSRNVQNQKFMNLFSPNIQKIEKLGMDIHNNSIDKYNYYISICINYISYLVNRYENEGRNSPMWFALRAYNAGERINTIYASDRRLRKSTNYANKVYKILKQIQNERGVI